MFAVSGILGLILIFLGIIVIVSLCYSRTNNSKPIYIQLAPLTTKTKGNKIMDIEALEKLVTLKEKGLITEQEFIAKKEELLSEQVVNDTSEKVRIGGFIFQDMPLWKEFLYIVLGIILTFCIAAVAFIINK